MDRAVIRALLFPLCTWVLYGFQPERGTAQASGSPTGSLKLLKGEGQACVMGFTNEQVIMVVALNPLIPNQ